MSRIGNKVINLPAGVEVTNNNNVVTVKGPKGELTREFDKNIEIKVEGTEVSLHRPNDSKEMKTIHGTTRALLANMIQGCSVGFSRKLLISGIGYRAALRGTALVLNMGYSHEVVINPIDGVEFKLFDNTVGTSKQQGIEVLGADKQKVGQFAAEVRELRPPEPYKGKGIKYVDEVIIRKEGKAGKGK